MRLIRVIASAAIVKEEEEKGNEGQLQQISAQTQGHGQGQGQGQGHGQSQGQSQIAGPTRPTGSGSVLDISRLPRFNAGGKIFLKGNKSTVTAKETPNPVAKVEFICGGKALLVLHANGSVTVSIADFGSDSMETTNASRVGNDSNREKDREDQSSIHGNLTAIVPLQAALKEGNGPIMMATCGAIVDESVSTSRNREDNRKNDSNGRNGSNIFALVRGNIVSIYRVDLPVHHTAPPEGTVRDKFSDLFVAQCTSFCPPLSPVSDIAYTVSTRSSLSFLFRFRRSTNVSQWSASLPVPLPSCHGQYNGNPDLRAPYRAKNHIHLGILPVHYFSLRNHPYHAG